MSSDFVLIASGNELVKGKKLNTNTQYIAEQLTKAYIATAYHITCQDNEQQFFELLASAASKHNVIITGGLGPTDDDITRDIIADIVNKPLQYQSEVAESVTKYLAKLNLKVMDRHHKQFYFPENAILFANNNGTAWGFAINHGENWIYALPGPPPENQPMFQACISHIQSVIKPNIEHRLHWVIKAPEERIVSFIDSQVTKHSLDIETCAHKNGLCDVYLSLGIKDWSANKAKELITTLEQAWLHNNLTFETKHKLRDDYE